MEEGEGKKSCMFLKIKISVRHIKASCGPEVGNMCLCRHGHSSASSLINTYVSFCVWILLHTLTHNPCCSPSPSTFLLSYQNRNDVILLVAPDGKKTESKVHSSSILLSACLFLVSRSVCLSDRGTSGHPESPATPPGLCVRRKEGRKEGPVVTQEGGFREREGGSVKGCLSWS